MTSDKKKDIALVVFSVIVAVATIALAFNQAWYHGGKW